MKLEARSTGQMDSYEKESAGRFLHQEQSANVSAS
jgi:hypothetical protein